MLGHLFPATKKGRGVYSQRRFDPRRSAADRVTSSPREARKKAMRFEDFNRLVRHETNVRDLLL
jgi:hypothetical protein